MTEEYVISLNKTALTLIFKMLYKDIEHGDEEHRKWLKDKMDEHLAKILSAPPAKVSSRSAVSLDNKIIVVTKTKPIG